MSKTPKTSPTPSRRYGHTTKAPQDTNDHRNKIERPRRHQQDRHHQFPKGPAKGFPKFVPASILCSFHHHHHNTVTTQSSSSSSSSPSSSSQHHHPHHHHHHLHPHHHHHHHHFNVLLTNHTRIFIITIIIVIKSPSSSSLIIEIIIIVIIIILNILPAHFRQISVCVQMQGDMIFFNASTPQV